MNVSDIGIWCSRVLSGDELGSSYRSRSSVVYLGAGLIATVDGVKKYVLDFGKCTFLRCRKLEGYN
jgi:hypothetical protein